MAGAQPVTDAIIFFAHGSRDPAWAEPFEAITAHTRELAPNTVVQLAYLELMAPDLPSAVRACIATGVRHISIVPLFLGRGRHVGKDLTRLVAEVREQHPEVTFDMAPAIGEWPGIVQAVAREAVDRLARN